MKTIPNNSRNHGAAMKLVASALILAAALALGHETAARAAQTPGVISPGASAGGLTYGQWSAAWWQWAMEFPVNGSVPHPFVDDLGFDITAGQSGHVWFLGTPFGQVERTCAIPPGTVLFVGLVNAEASDLEDLGNTPQDRAATASWLADHILRPFFEVDGKQIGNMAPYRVQSPDFAFTAPTPWIYGSVGGAGHSTGDGYFVMLHPLSAGQHTLHYGGSFHFSAAADGFDFDADIEMTYHLTVH